MSQIQRQALKINMTIESLWDYTNYVETNYPNSKGWIYRGQAGSGEGWDLQPQAGRPDCNTMPSANSKRSGQVTSDLDRFDEWTKMAKKHFHNLPEKEYDRLAHAQHYGLITRLLDWSTNPCVALFFAVEKEILDANQNPINGEVFFYRPRWIVNTSAPVEHDISLSWAVCLLNPVQKDYPRIQAQHGVFTYHYNPSAPMLKELEKDNLVSIKIPADSKRRLREELRKENYSRDVLIPDFEGISKEINSMTNEMAMREFKTEVAWDEPPKS